MYKKSVMHVQSCCFAYNTYCFLTFSSPSASLDLKVPIGCWNQRKLKALILRVVVFANDQPSAERRIDFAVFFIVLWSQYSRKICLNMCPGNSENSDSCSYLLRICFIYGTNVSVS